MVDDTRKGRIIAGNKQTLSDATFKKKRKLKAAKRYRDYTGKTKGCVKQIICSQYDTFNMPTSYQMWVWERDHTYILTVARD